MLTISRYLIDSHLIFSKIILTKISQKDNSWVQQLQSILKGFGSSVLKQLNLDYDVTLEQVF